MPNALIALGGAFVVAGLLGRLGRRVGLPTIPFFIAAGILTGPGTPGLVLFDHPERIELIAQVGLVLLLFHLGLEFSLDDLVGGGGKLLSAGSFYIVLNVGGGVLFGLVLDWGWREALVLGGAIGISSSAIVTKLLVELRRLANPETAMILGITVFQDVFLAAYLAALQPVLGKAQGFGGGALVFLRAFGFLAALFAVARYATRQVGRLVDVGEDELLTVLFVGLAILVAGLAEELGVSGAIGALACGFILARTKVAGRVERLVLPLKDAFAAIFFFAFGLTVRTDDVGAVAVPVLFAVVLTVATNAAAGLAAARIFGLGRARGITAAFTLLGRGEFSLILATLAAASGLDTRLGPFVALYVLILALGGPLLAARFSPGDRTPSPVG